MARQFFEADVPDGYRLGAADGEDDAYRGLLFDAENKLAGHATFRPVDDPGVDTQQGFATSPKTPMGDFELDEETREQLEVLATVLAAMLIYAIKVAAEAAAPHIVRWWNDTFVAAFTHTIHQIGAAWDGLFNVAKLPPRVPEHEPEELGAEAPQLSSGALLADQADLVGLVLEDLRVQMSSAEARNRLVAALMAKDFYDRQVELLQHALIVEAEQGPSEVSSDVDMPPRELVAEALQRMLAQDPTFFDRLRLDEIVHALDHGRVELLALPLRTEMASEALNSHVLDPDS